MVIIETLRNLLMKKYELDEIKKLYSEEVDKHIIDQLKLFSNKFVGGNFKITYIDEGHYEVSYDLYFKEENNDEECLKKTYKSKLLDLQKYLKPEAITELREKKTIVYEITPPDHY